jgi:hypothetical protein
MGQEPRELIPTEAIGLVVYMLFRPERPRLTVKQVAKVAQCSRSGAARLLYRLERVLPLHYDAATKTWGALSDGDES